MSPELLRALLTIGFGALAGGLTNSVAVWMLFHPYEPPRLGPFRIRFLHGAVPKNQARLAEAIGRTVGDRLLTQEDLTRILSSPEFREAFDQRLERFLSELLERDRGPLRELLPEGARDEAARLLEEVGTFLAERLERWIDSEAFATAVEGRIEGLFARLSDRPVEDLLTAEREEALVATVDEWLSLLAERASFERAVGDYLDRGIETFLQDDRTFEEVLPEGLVSSLERALSGYLPLAARKLGGILDDPGARARLERTVHELFQRFVSDLRFHQRLMARLVVTEDTLDKMLRTLEAEGAEHLSEMLRDPVVQEAMSGRVNEAVLDFLRRPVTSVLGRPGDENVDRARDTVVGWLLGVVRDPDMRSFLVEKLRQALERAARGSWGDLLSGVPAGRVGAGVVSVARSETAKRGYREALDRVLTGLLDRPVGRPADWLPPGSTHRIRQALSEPLWSWLQDQSPHVVRTLDVKRRVEEKVRSYPTAKLEELVRRVTHRELRLIVRLGYLLGGVIGGVLVLINTLLT